MRRRRGSHGFLVNHPSADFFEDIEEGAGTESLLIRDQIVPHRSFHNCLEESVVVRLFLDVDAGAVKRGQHRPLRPTRSCECDRFTPTMMSSPVYDAAHFCASYLRDDFCTSVAHVNLNSVYENWSWSTAFVSLLFVWVVLRCAGRSGFVVSDFGWEGISINSGGRKITA